MKEDQAEYLEEQKLKEIIKKYCQFIRYPIWLMVQKEIEDERIDEEPVVKKNRKNKCFTFFF